MLTWITSIVTAAYLALSGIEGPRQILEAEDGSFLFAMSDTSRLERIEPCKPLLFIAFLTALIQLNIRFSCDFAPFVYFILDIL